MNIGIEGSKKNDKPWKTRIERDIIMQDDLKESGIQGGKVLADKLALFSFIIGIPILIIGLYASFNMILGWGFDVNIATIILVIIINVLGLLLILGGYNIHRG